jgi:hypothetical protein
MTYLNSPVWLYPAIALLLLCFPVAVGAQVSPGEFTIRGCVVDSQSRAALPFAIVQVNTSGGQADSAGCFILRVLPAARYEVTIQYSGYHDKKIVITPGRDSLLDIKNIRLARNASQLRTVDIRGNPPLVKKELDRLVYDVQADPDHKTQSVLDILAKVPLITVDGENNIKLKGQGNFKVFINGKPSAMTARNPKDALKAMPAVNIASIAIITTPPAKYDGEGFTGIINIVTVKRASDGYNATIGAGFNRVSGLGQNYTLMAKKGRWGINTTGYIYEDLKRTNAISLKQERTKQPSSVLNQDGTAAYRSTFGSATLEVSYEIDSLQLLTAAVSLYKSSDYYVTSQHITEPTTSYQYTNNNHVADNSLDVSVGYDKAGKRNKKEIFSLGYRLHHSPQQLSNDIFYDQVTGEQMDNFSQWNNNLLDEHTFQADYVLPLPSVQIESGIKSIWREGNSKYIGASAAEGFTYQQQVYSLYHSYQFNTPVLAVKAGVRLEYTVMDAQYAAGKNVKEGYYNLVPVVSLQHDFQHSSLSFAFTRRAERPGIEQLNPFVDKSNPKQLSTGNPDLRPVMQNSAEVSFMAGTKVNYHLIGSFLFANNTIQKVMNFTDSNAITTYRNIGNNRDLRLNAGFSYNITRNIRIIVNADGSYVWLRGTDGKSTYSNSGYNVSGFVNLNYKITDSWRVTTTLYAVSPSIRLQGETNGNIVHVVRINKELFKKRGTLTLSLSNPYAKYRYVRSTQYGEAFDQLSVQQLNYRNYGVSFTYSFGKLSPAIRKNQQSINNDDVKTPPKKSS